MSDTDTTPEDTPAPLCPRCRDLRKIARKWEHRARKAQQERDAAKTRADEAERRFNELDKKLVAIAQIVDM